MFNLSKFIKSFSYAYQGISYSLKSNQNIKIHLIIAILVLILGVVLNLSGFELFAIGLMVVLVISAEMINSAIEEVVNLLVQEHRHEAKVAKDVSAGMVLLVSMFALIVGFFVFLPHLLVLIK